MLAHKIIAQIGLKSLNTIFGFVAAILVSRAFLPEMIGDVLFIVGLCTLATMFSDLGFNTAANTKIAQEKFTPESNIGTLIYYKIILSVFYFIVITITYFINSAKIDGIGVNIFFIISFALLLNNFSTALQQYFVGKRHFYKFMISNFFAQLSNNLFVIFISIYAPTRFNFALAIIIQSVVLFSIIIFYYRNIKIDWTIRKDIFLSYFKYAAPLMIMTPIFTLIGNAESIVLPYLISSASLGIFYFGLKFYNAIQIISKTFTSYIYTYVCNVMNRMDGEKLYKELDNLTIITQVFATILTVGLINRSGFLTILLFGQKYAISSVVSQLMCFMLYCEMVLSNYGHIIYAAGIQKKLIKWTILSGFVLIIAMIVLIPNQIFGIKLFGLDFIGMPISTLLRLLTTGLLASIILTKQILGRSFISTQIKMTILFVLYLILDYLFLSLYSQSIIWVFFTWFIDLSLYTLFVYSFFVDKSVKTDFKNVFSLKKIKDGFIEV